MAHIVLRSPHPTEGAGAQQLIINGVDVSMDVFSDIELVRVGDPRYPEYQEVGFRVTYALTSLELDGAETTVTDQFETVAFEVAQAVKSFSPPPPKKRRWWQRSAA